MPSENLGCHDASADSASPDPPVSQDSPACSALPSSSPQTLPIDPASTAAQAPPPPAPGPAPNCISTNQTSQSPAKKQPKKDSKPKFRKLKYHQYIPPDQKTEKEPLLIDYNKLLQLQLRISKQTSHNYPTILPAPPRPPQQTTSTNGPMCPTTRGRGQDNLPGLPSNLEEMKVSELKQQLKNRGLILSGTKHNLIQRLRNYHRYHGGGAFSTLTSSQFYPPEHSTTQSENTATGVTLISGLSDRGAPIAVPPMVHQSSHAYSQQALAETGCDVTQFADTPNPHMPMYATDCHVTPPTEHTGSSHPTDNYRELKEKDRRIAELTLMLQEKQRLVEELRSKLQDHEPGSGVSEKTGIAMEMEAELQHQRNKLKSKHIHHRRKKNYKQQQQQQQQQMFITPDHTQTLMSDTESNHRLLKLTNHGIDIQAGDDTWSEVTDQSTLQESSSDQSVPLLQKSDIQSKQQRIFKQPIKKTLKPEKCTPTYQVKARPSLSALMFFDAVDSVPTKEANRSSIKQKKVRLQSHILLQSTAPPFHQSPPHQVQPTTSFSEPMVDPSLARMEKSKRLEDFLESTTGKPLFGVEPGGHVTLIDELHSQLLSTPSILDPPALPMDTYDFSQTCNNQAALDLVDSGFDGMDWLELGEDGATDTVGGNGHASFSVFSADFLDGSDLQLHLDSCL